MAALMFLCLSGQLVLLLLERLCLVNSVVETNALTVDVDADCFVIVSITVLEHTM